LESRAFFQDMSATLVHSHTSLLGYSVPATVPTSWRKDVSKIETLFRALLSRHSETEVAQLVVLAAARNLAGARKPRSGMAMAMMRGVLAQQGIKEAEGGGVSAEEARPFLGNITRQAVLDRYKKGRLLGWRENRQNAVRFPLWQFTAKGTLPGLEEVLAILRSSPAADDWGAILFFLNKRDSLGGKRPLDALREGDIEAVKRAAHGFAAP
jgi:hypothetical protein